MDNSNIGLGLYNRVIYGSIEGVWGVRVWGGVSLRWCGLGGYVIGLMDAEGV